MKNTDREGTLRLLKQYGPHMDISNTQKHNDKCSKKEYYTRQKCQMKHSMEMLSKVCLQEHKLNTEILNVRNTHNEEIQKFRQKQVIHIDIACTQQHKWKFSKKESMRDYVRNEHQVQCSSKTSQVCTTQNK